MDEQSRRLAVADLRGFVEAGAGPRRRAALAAHTSSWLARVWAEATEGLRPGGIALAAVGSVGRAEAGPLSDIDLVLLHDGRTFGDDAVTRVADRVWYPIWDAGVRLDHSVRTVAQCRSVAQSDLAATVGLLDLTTVAGDRDLVAAARATVGHDWRAGARRRLPELLESLAARHTRHGDLAQSLEPDLKEARGGLRDLTVLSALAEAWLVERPRGDLDTAAGLLLDVRDAVHVVTGRGRDRLLREDHDAVAALLGYADADDLLTEVSSAGRTVAHALDGAVRGAGQAQRARVLRVGPRRPQMVPLGHGLFVSDGEVVLGHERLLEEPTMPLRAAVLAARESLPIAPRTLRNLAGVPDLPTPWPEAARDLLGDLLGAGPGLVSVWESLDQAGLVERWIPEWTRVRSRPQRSPVHRHTVDRHLIETVVHARGLVREVARPDLLLVAALLHDIGKVRGAHDHSHEGAPVARAIAERIGLSAPDVDTVELLVREHLTLIELATRRDHTDPGTVDAALAAVGADAERFELLRALTEADAAAAGPAAWTDWRATLLAQLTAAVRARLDADRSDRRADRGSDRGAERGADQRVDEGADPSVADACTKGPTGQVGPTGRSTPLGPEDLEQVRAGRVVVRGMPHGTAWRLDIVSADRMGLFADTAGVLACAHFVVRTAIVRTVDGVAVNEWHVEAPGGEAPDVGSIVRSLERLATGDQTPLRDLDRRRPRLARPSATADVAGPGQARAMVVPGASPEATVLEVRAQDRPALLHDLGRAFTGAGIAVRSAHVATYAGQTLDTFYLTDAHGSPLQPAVVGRLVGLVIDTCEGARGA